MRGQTKIAVAVGAIVIIAGVYYLGSGDKDAGTPTAANDTTAPDKPVSPEQNPSLALNTIDPPPVSAAPAGTNTDSHSTVGGHSTADSHSTGIASPSPRRIDDSALGFTTSGGSARPQPAETHEPVPPMAPTALPSDRSSMTGVLPNMGTPKLDVATVSAHDEDMPPNADKNAQPAPITLPPIEPVGIASSTTGESATTTALPADAAKPQTGEPATSLVTTGSTAARSADKPADKSTEQLAVKTTSTEKAKPREYIVQSGDTFSSIALKQLGSAKHVKALMKANPGKDPKKLYVGTKLILPDVPGAAPSDKATVQATTTTKTPFSTTPPAKAADKPAKDTFEVPPPDPSRSYTVQAGEGWYDLARKFLGDGKNYPELYEYNKERVGGDPHLLRAGTVIELPPNAKLPAKNSTAVPATK
ncbi:MAG TPA: LysM peptidoglycan-binding domain-containing protein [Phycisphaerae bacterium]|nr:LysM peptidoglycan-binding domain-containing protein [Phycisphaerae bacterium]HOJ72405.1 LysM peptidoglycan-binding domain-containing protein [Phycisphaerae bacterium]HOM49933.1 LysM peptidoglycan-binding domain-containing protein [Phycisphaerae bacterium]HON66965.1 LysM peptidoglycan-binding domain-containing protein [Phycisphaerae bacterium]HOQ87417.1 LysM peptidoglycan-binding domain-containing protein [Phycisphaerae bacterium]